jgi:hypothetical protein
MVVLIISILLLLNSTVGISAPFLVTNSSNQTITSCEIESSAQFLECEMADNGSINIDLANLESGVYKFRARYMDGNESSEWTSEEVYFGTPGVGVMSMGGSLR